MRIILRNILKITGYYEGMECDTLKIFFLCMLIQYSQGLYAWKCPEDPMKKCDCGDSHSEIQLQCPLDNNIQIALHIFPENKVKIECHDNPVYDIFPRILPDFKIGDLEKFNYKSCYLPNSSFSSTLKKFNINKIEFMEMENILNTNTVTKELFNGLSTIKHLELRHSAKIRFDDNFLENLPNLEILHLENNNMRYVNKRMFQYTPNLRDLRLSYNSLSNLSNEVFKNLSELRTLILNNNKLTTLNKHMFTGLRTLESLGLSSNNIMSLDEDIFAEITKLSHLHLQQNHLSVIVSNIFKYNTALTEVHIGANPNLNLSDYVFANFTNLTRISINYSNLEVLPQHTFKGSNNIHSISLKYNNIKKLPENVFKDLVNLKILHLEDNKIVILPNRIFSTLTNLEELYLGGNSLTEFNEHLFKNTPNLRTLVLKNNKIATIHLKAFINVKNLNRIDLSQYQYDGNNIDIYPEKLLEINLSFNLIDKFPNISNRRELILNLDHNRITFLRVASVINFSKVQLNNNNISVLDFGDVSRNVNRKTLNITALHISNNPIICNCTNFDLIQYSNSNLKTMVNITMDDLRCFAPEAYKNTAVKDLKVHQITCLLEDEGCPKQCTCDFRPYDTSALIDCSYRNLTNVPRIYLTNTKITQIEVNLEGNGLESAPYEGLGYDNVTRLFLSNNRIINLSWIPPKIQILTLNGNRLKFLDSKVLHSLNESTTLTNLTLDGNPWNCDCSTVGLQTYLHNHYTKVNVSTVRCEDNSLLGGKTDLCISHFTILLTIVTPILIILVAIAVVVAMYFYYQENIKAWLYAKNLCLWLITEEELDQDKTYDIFISYSQKDEDFVIENLLPVLEAGPNPFKVCIHIRDWVPGEFISTQVTNSVLNSRRTLVILSENFLESVWGKIEFSTAHTQAINEGQTRVIVVKYGPLNEEKLDSELKTYLKTNTYVEWGDPWFWIKLKYALRSGNIQYYKTNHDKYELVTSSPSALGVHSSDLTPDISVT